MDEAKKRGVHLRTPVLRELYRHRLLVPFVQLTNKPVREAAKPEGPESPLGGTRLVDLRWARDTGRLRDPAVVPYQPRLSFEPTKWTWPSSSPWTGVMYSPYQLLVLPELESLLAKVTYHKRSTQIIARLPEPRPALVERMERLRKVAVALTAVEARYLPNLDPEFIQLTNVGDPKDWANYSASFDPVQTQAWLAYPSEQLRQDAEGLLSRAHRRDPVGDDWSQLMRRAPVKARKYLKDAALLAMDDRIAAEILLRFYEDLVLRGQAEPLPDLSGGLGWHPLVERLSFRRDTLDENLVDLGISPYPRVVLALEGETEVYHAPLVWRTLGYSEAPELMRLLKLGGVDQKLQKVAALNVAPLIGNQVPASKAIAWTVIRPSATLILAVDPDNRFNTPDKLAKERVNILNEVKDVLKAQGVERPNPDELDHLVPEIRVWGATCYEFEHFDAEELAEGIMAVHWTIDGWTREQLVEALRYWRDVKKQDIKYVWLKGRWDDQANRLTGKWAYEVSKTKLAEALWPALLRRVQLAMVAEDAPVPAIMKVVIDAYRIAQQRRYLSFVLTEVPEDLA